MLGIDNHIYFCISLLRIICYQHQTVCDPKLRKHPQESLIENSFLNSWKRRQRKKKIGRRKYPLNLARKEVSYLSFFVLWQYLYVECCIVPPDLFVQFSLFLCLSVCLFVCLVLFVSLLPVVYFLSYLFSIYRWATKNLDFKKMMKLPKKSTHRWQVY